MVGASSMLYLEVLHPLAGFPSPEDPVRAALCKQVPKANTVVGLGL